MKGRQERICQNRTRRPWDIGLLHSKRLDSSIVANCLMDTTDYRPEGAKCHSPEALAQSAII